MSNPASIPLLRATELKCEYRTEPLGIDDPRPRLSWLLDSADPRVRAQRQSAYQVIVASDPDALQRGQADRWDSGRVESAQTMQVEYAGAVPGPSAECWWKVRVWNSAGEAGPWSETARWTMGLPGSSAWEADWIGYDAPPPPAAEPADADLVDLAGCHWIWAPEASADGAASDPRYFRHCLELPAGRTVRRAVLMIASRRRFQFWLNDRSIASGLDQSQWARSFDVADHLRPGRNQIAIEAGMEQAETAGIVGKLHVALDDGSTVELSLDTSWKCSSRRWPAWTAADFDDSAWPEAVNICPFGAEAWGTPQKHRLILPPPAYLRRTFVIERPVRRAFIYASALGVFEMHLNGSRVGQDYLSPGWTDYRKRVHYHTYDVTELLRDGANALGAIVADGWYAGYLGYTGGREFYGPRPRFIAQLHIEHTDGSTQVVRSDRSWRAARGPLLAADLLMGCTYDARGELPGWDTAGFDAGGWDPVSLGPDIRVPLHSHPATPVARTDEVPARSVRQSDPGVYVFDLGQNIVGFVRLEVSAPAGTRIKLRHAEALNPDGSIYTASLRAALATDAYICKGGEREIWEPQFTFHGFRYVEVRGLPRRPMPGDLAGIVIHSSMQRSGWFECSHPLVNQLFDNVIWGQKGNYLEVPTDCPQRDERLGWTGDAQVFFRTGAYNFDIAPFFSKWLVDLVQDSRLPDGSFASVAPDILNGAGAGSSAWADAGVICPYLLYRFYGDRRIIERHYDAMARYIDFLSSRSEGFIKDQGVFGDWLHLGGGAHTQVIGTAYFEHVTRLMSEMAAAIGREIDASRYRDLANKIRLGFIGAFVEADGRIKQSSQTGYALAFTMDLLPAHLQAAAANRLVEEIRRFNWHLATGFIGTPRLLPALSRAGRSDVAYRLLLTETYPGWLFQVKQGATTVWERWDGWTPEKGYQDPGMNSLNHYAFGSVGEWLYRTVAGIDCDEPGFSRIRIAPEPGGGLTHASAAYNSIRGRIESAWELDDDALTLSVTIPLNTTATVRVPGVVPCTVRESGVPIEQADSVRIVRSDPDEVICAVGSGAYVFTGRRAALS